MLSCCFFKRPPSTKTAQPTNAFDSLPKELKFLIFSMMNDKKDLAHISQVCKQWKNYIEIKDSKNEEIFWKKFTCGLSRKALLELFEDNFNAAQNVFNKIVFNQVKQGGIINNAWIPGELPRFHPRICFLGAPNSSKNILYELPGKTINSSAKSKSHLDRWFQWRLVLVENTILKLINLNDSENLDKLAYTNHIPDVILVSILKEEEIAKYSEMLAKHANTKNAVLLFVVKAEQNNELQVPKALKIVLDSDDTLYSIYNKLFDKVKNIASLSILNSDTELMQKLEHAQKGDYNELLSRKIHQFFVVKEIAKFEPKLQKIVPAINKILNT